MNAERFHAIAGRYPQLRVGVVGDFFLDRYLIIDPRKEEVSIETGLLHRPSSEGEHYSITIPTSST